MSDTPRTDVAEHNMGSVAEPHYVVDADFSRYLERELVGARAELDEAQKELNDKRKFCYAVEQALDGLKGDYVEIIAALRKDAERYRWLRERHENTIMDIYNSISPAMIKPEMFDAAIDAAIRKGE
jgi:hypothetical protein